MGLGAVDWQKLRAKRPKQGKGQEPNGDPAEWRLLLRLQNRRLTGQMYKILGIIPLGKTKPIPFRYR